MWDCGMCDSTASTLHQGVPKVSQCDLTGKARGTGKHPHPTNPSPTSADSSPPYKPITHHCRLIPPLKTHHPLLQTPSHPTNPSPTTADSFPPYKPITHHHRLLPGGTERAGHSPLQQWQLQCHLPYLQLQLAVEEPGQEIAHPRWVSSELCSTGNTGSLWEHYSTPAIEQRFSVHGGWWKTPEGTKLQPTDLGSQWAMGALGLTPNPLMFFAWNSHWANFFSTLASFDE